MISQAYQDGIKRRVVTDFISANSRSPTTAELRELMRQALEVFSTIDDVGFTGFDSTVPAFKGRSSAEQENANRQANIDDMQIISHRLGDVSLTLETGFRQFYSTSMKTKKLLAQIENRLDNLLLLNDAVDVFVYGIEEDFTTQEAVDHLLSTAEVESGWVTLGRGSYASIPLTDVELTNSIDSDQGILAIKTIGGIDNLRADDGSFWETMVTTAYQQGRVSLVLDIVLPEPTDLLEIRITGKPVESGGRATITVMASTDGLAYSSVGPVEQVMRTGENQLPIGKDAIKKIRILVTKQSSDDTTSTNQFIYLFSLDSIKLYTDTFQDTLESQIVCGPYSVTDEMGTVFNYSKAKLEACTVTPDQTAVSFYLSQDGEVWTAVSYADQSLSVANFGSGDISSTYLLIDEARQSNQLVLDPVENLSLDGAQEALFNIYIPAAEVSQVNLRTVKLHRNTPQSAQVYGVASGWQLDPQTREYKTTVYVDAPQGRSIDLGSSSAKLNGSNLSGLVTIPYGYSTFATQDTNWYTVEDDLASLDELAAGDPVYPYNHKLLIEGYDYPTLFIGERVYGGVGDWFAALLEYVPPEAFHLHNGDLQVYTVEEFDGSLYFKVKVKKQDATWQSELFNLSYTVQRAATNQLFVKAILSTVDSKISPRIDSFRVRVI